MSRENVEIVRRLNELADREGVVAALEATIAADLFDEDVEWVEDPTWPVWAMFTPCSHFSRASSPDWRRPEAAAAGVLRAGWPTPPAPRL
jgi:hypothetical protein